MADAPASPTGGLPPLNSSNRPAMLQTTSPMAQPQPMAPSSFSYQQQPMQPMPQMPAQMPPQQPQPMPQPMPQQPYSPRPVAPVAAPMMPQMPAQMPPQQPMPYQPQPQPIPAQGTMPPQMQWQPQQMTQPQMPAQQPVQSMQPVRPVMQQPQPQPIAAPSRSQERNPIFGPAPAATQSVGPNLDMFSKTPPSAIDVQVDQPSYQAMVSAEDQKDLFGHERLTSTQKIVIVVIALVALSLILGAGLWVYSKVIAQGSTTTMDTDADGLTDAEEETLGTNPNKRDTDDDGYFDGEEVKNGYSPLGK